MITWTRVESSTIARIGYDGSNLFIKLVGADNGPGPTHEYLDVPELVYIQFLHAHSYSGFYKEQIVGKYRLQKRSVNPPTSTQYFTGPS